MAQNSQDSAMSFEKQVGFWKLSSSYFGCFYITREISFYLYALIKLYSVL